MLKNFSGRRALEGVGLSIRPAKRDSRSWRFETCRKSFAELLDMAPNTVISRVKKYGLEPG